MRAWSALLAALFVFAVTASAEARTATSGGTFVFGTDVDAVVLDPALGPDLATARVTNQIYESLVDLAPGRTTVVPALATRWTASKDARTWTFFLRRGVRFHDGKPFNAAAVCFNFERWYGFSGSLQSAAVYWKMAFAGFRTPEPDQPGPDKSLYRGCDRVSNLTVRLRLARPTASFLAALAYPNLGIASPTALRKYDADAGEAEPNGLFHPAGTYGTAHPTGTGPFVFRSWRPRREVVLVRNARYWGRKAKLDRLVFRVVEDRLERLHALERGTIHGLDLVPTGGTASIKRNRKLKLLDRPPGNVAFVAMNQSIPPLDKLAVRQAVAYGLDRAAVVRSFYGGQGQLADQLLPPAFEGHTKVVRRYPFDPAKSRALLRKARLTLPVKLDFWYPTDVRRPYMPDPKRNFEAFAASLERAGFQIVAHGVPWTEFITTFIKGKAQLYLAGWAADLPDPDNFFDPYFAEYMPLYGFRNAKLFALVHRAHAEPNPAARRRLYEQASRRLMEVLPVAPYAYFKFAVALRRNVVGFVPDPSGPVNESFANVSFR